MNWGEDVFVGKVHHPHEFCRSYPPALKLGEEMMVSPMTQPYGVGV